jgi:hypothetical protein
MADSAVRPDMASAITAIVGDLQKVIQLPSGWLGTFSIRMDAASASVLVRWKPADQHIAINSFGASHQIKMFAMARVEHKGPPMPFMGPLGGPEYAAANPINLHCHCALAYPG